MAKNAQFYIEEFLFRGRSKEDGRPTDWHVIVGVEGLDPAGRAHQPLPIMPSAKAVEAGWDVPDIIADINGQLMGELEAERAKVRQLGESLDQSQGEVRTLGNTVIALQEQLKTANAEIAGMKKEMADAAAEKQTPAAETKGKKS